MIELLKQFDFQDGVAAVCFLSLVFLLWFRLYWNRNKGEFVENVEQLKESVTIYRLSRSNWFYKGTPPTINESAFHEPQVLIKPCMLLKYKTVIDEYIVFEVKANECKRSEHKLNGETVYYKKELFDNLDKKEL